MIYFHLHTDYNSTKQITINTIYGLFIIYLFSINMNHEFYKEDEIFL